MCMKLKLFFTYALLVGCVHRKNGGTFFKPSRQNGIIKYALFITNFPISTNYYQPLLVTATEPILDIFLW